MRVHEFQAKQILAGYGLPVPRGGVAVTPDQAADIASRVGPRVVLKAQVHAGGRGKAGGIKLASNPEQARQFSQALFGSRLVTPQTGPQGKVVKRLLVEEAFDIGRELYLGLVIDKAREAAVVIASPLGGVEIEKTAEKEPGLIFKEYIDPALGLAAFQARRLAFRLGLEGDLHKQAVKLILNLYRAFESTDASLVEVNPLLVSKQGAVIALDAKMVFDDNGLARHPEISALRDLDEESPLEVQAARHGLNYIKLDGQIGCLVNGAGLAMATMDLIMGAGGMPANFLDLGGGVSEEAVANAFKVLVADPDVKAALVNIFGGIVRCDLVANGIVKAAREVGLKVPLVVRMKGMNVDLGKKVLAESGLTFYSVETMKDAAEMVVPLARPVPEKIS